MCGLVGLFDTRGRRGIDGGLLRRMNDAQAHRGPDGDGLHLSPGIGLGHRRLAIIDVEGGHQPLANEDGSVVVVFNGEIYNYRPLIAELEREGHRFHTRSDTEVIVHAWEQWGADCVRRFHGMFAFALWDQNSESLFLARDRLGKKPLYTALLADGMLAFASELAALRQLPDLPRELDPLAVEEYFAYGFVPDPRSIYRAVRKLPPANRLLWRRGDKMRQDLYWSLPMGGAPIHDMGEAAAQLAEHLFEATRIRLMSEVPLGAFLSGGIDSSAVVACMARASDQPVKTFSIGFADPDFDESGYAAAVAERFGTDHLSRRVIPDDFALIDRLASVYGEPFGDSSAMPTYQVCSLAAEQVTVALSGDGGDELFGGYRRYALAAAVERARRLLPEGLRRPLFGTLGRITPKLDWAPRPFRAKTTLQELAMDQAHGYFAAVSVVDDELRAELFSPGFRRELQGYGAVEVTRRAMAAADTDDPLLKMQAADLAAWLPGGILVKVDRASMARSLEVRAPLLDHTLAEWAARLAPELKLAYGQGKRVLKHAMEPILPADILYRPKRGFSLPLKAWFRGPLKSRAAALADNRLLAECGLFDMAAIRRIGDQHIAGRRDHGRTLWLLLMFEAFLRLDAGVIPARFPIIPTERRDEGHFTH